jgi:CBS domain-containing protein
MTKEISMNASLEPFIHRKIVILHEDSTAFQAAKALCEHQIGCVLVSDRHSNMTGVLTDRDLVCSVMAMELSPDIALKEIMSPMPITVTEAASLGDAIALMEKHGLRRIPVLSAGQSGHRKCVGIVTLDDLLAAGAITPEHASRIVRSQILWHHAH